VQSSKERFAGNKAAVSVALLLIDVINDLDFDEADLLLHQALPMAKRLAALKCEASRFQIPTVYIVSDTYRLHQR
jgi:nicotinamidase-related amidase